MAGYAIDSAGDLTIDGALVVAGTISTVGGVNNITGGLNGSFPYQTAVNTTTMRAIGSTNQVLMVIGGVPTWKWPFIPQNSRSANYTTTISDGGGHIYHPSADTSARTWTIDSNANVAYDIGTAITFVNDTSAGVITIAITSDTLVLSPSGATGSRTLAANGMATAIKMTATRWMISGTGLT